MQFSTSKLPAIIEAMAYIAHNDEHHAIGGRKLAQILGFAPRYLEPFLQNLAKAGVLSSVRGPKGGYKLEQGKRNISLAQICAIASGDEATQETENSEIQQKIIAPIFATAHENYLSSLAQTSLQNVLELTYQAKLGHVLDLSCENDETINYVI